MISVKFASDPGSRTLDPGSRTQDPGSRTQDPGSRSQDPGSRTLDPGSRTLDPGFRTLDPGSRTLDPGSRTLDSGPWMQDPGSRTLDPGFCILDRGSRVDLNMYKKAVYQSTLIEANGTLIGTGDDILSFHDLTCNVLRAGFLKKVYCGVWRGKSCPERSAWRA